MKPFPSLRSLVTTVAASVLVPLFASAHPGHDHSDIPAVIRRPFASVVHVVVTATLLVAAAGVVMLMVRLWRASSRDGTHSRIARHR